MQLGWGGGWEGKTLGSHLRRDEKVLEGIISDYRLARRKREFGDPFPKSRRTTVRRIRGRDGQAVDRISLPLGWVLVELEELF